MLEPVPDPSYIPERRRVLPFERVGALVEILICSGFPTQVLLILVMRGFGMPMHAADGRLSPAFVFTLSLLDALLVVGLVVTFLRAHHESPREVLLGNVRLFREGLLGLATLPGVFMLVTLVLMLVARVAPQLHNVSTNPFEDMLQTRTDAIIFGVVVMIAGGVREEVQRGFIAHRFGQYLGGAVWGIGVYSVFFGAAHIDQGYDATIAIGLLGFIWGLLYISRRSIVAPVVSHALFNLAQLLKFLAFAAR
ncbi:MAG: CPBP family intramembrane glutamic endopeptidase [Vicinamibacterales bacterium]